MREHGQGRSNEIDPPYQLILAPVNIDAIDFKRSDIERIERAALACQRKAACYGLEEIAILFTLLPGLSAQHGPQLAVGVWLGGFNDQVGLP